MKVIKNERIIYFDVDSTLVESTISRTKEGTKREIVLEHIGNIDQVISHKKRKFFVVVWSANGTEWALEVVKHLRLEEFVDMVQTKPSAYFDDKNASEWMTQVFVKDGIE